MAKAETEIVEQTVYPDTIPDDMIVNGPLWNPEKYFSAEPQVKIVIMRDESDMLSDPTNKKILYYDTGMNGYSWHLRKNIPIDVPISLALMLEEMGRAYRVSS